jgi:hypothetical protein
MFLVNGLLNKFISSKSIESESVNETQDLKQDLRETLKKTIEAFKGILELSDLPNDEKGCEELSKKIVEMIEKNPIWQKIWLSKNKDLLKTAEEIRDRDYVLICCQIEGNRVWKEIVSGDKDYKDYGELAKEMPKLLKNEGSDLGKVGKISLQITSNRTEVLKITSFPPKIFSTSPKLKEISIAFHKLHTDSVDREKFEMAQCTQDITSCKVSKYIQSLWTKWSKGN